MDFISLYAGSAHECVFASEVDNTLRQVYLRNFGMLPYGDIRAVEMRSRPLTTTSFALASHVNPFLRQAIRTGYGTRSMELCSVTSSISFVSGGLST